MATTALRINNPELGEQRMLFMTAPTPTGIDIDIVLADAEFLPVGKPSLGAMNGSEEDYHKKLRVESSKKGQFVPEFSSNPEWNPGYVEPVEDVTHEEL